MKKLISALLTLAMIATVIPVAVIGTSAETAANSGNWTDAGNYSLDWAASLVKEEADANTVTVDSKNYQILGLSEQILEIKTAAELAGVAKLTNAAADNKKAFENVTLVLTADIDLAGHNWIPIGDVLEANNAFKFSGKVLGSKEKVDGTGPAITISNMTVDLSADGKYHSAGLIGGMSGGSVKNLCFVNASVTAYAGTIATVVGMALGGVTVQNVTSDARVVMTAGSSATHDNLGGIVGKAQANPITMIGCVFTGTLQGGTQTEKAGGILGATNGGDGHLVRDCVVISDGISGGSGRAQDWVAGTGGVIGVAANGFTVENCYVNAVISLPENSDNERVGGIVGAAWLGGTLKDVQFAGVVAASGMRYRGALIGAVGNPNNTVTLTNCLNTGISAGYDGGKLQFALISNMNSATTTLNATNVYSTSELLLMAGKTDLVACKSFDELQGDNAKAALTGFDFENIWASREGQLPVLAIAQDDATDPMSGGTDFSWFQPESSEAVTLTNLRQLWALSKLLTACGNQAETFLNARDLKIENVLIPLLDGLFDERAKTALLAKTVAVTDSANVVGVWAQTSKAAADGSYAVRFVAEIVGADWASAGFDLLVSYTAADGTPRVSKLTEQAVTVCYTSVIVDGNPQQAADGHYYLVFVLDGIPSANGDMTFTVSAHVENAEGVSYANAGQIVFDATGTVVTD